MVSEILILRFEDSTHESNLQSAQKVEIDYRYVLGFQVRCFAFGSRAAPSTYDFYTDEDQDCIEKCLLTITDNFGVVCIQKVYNRIDFENRKYNTNK